MDDTHQVADSYGQRPDYEEVDSIESLSTPEEHEHDDVHSEDYEIAEIRSADGTSITFYYDPADGELSFVEEGSARSRPMVGAFECESMLGLFLHLTPASTPVPEEFLEEADSGGSDTPALEREISTVPVKLLESATLATPDQTAALGQQACGDTYYDWWQWHVVGNGPKTYWSSTFGGKKRYASSYIFNCVPSNYPSWLWVRHRIYYKGGGGKYRKQYERKVGPQQWSRQTRGSVKRYRRINYDTAWGVSPGNPNLRYTREGRFFN